MRFDFIFVHTKREILQKKKNTAIKIILTKKGEVRYE